MSLKLPSPPLWPPRPPLASTLCRSSITLIRLSLLEAVRPIQERILPPSKPLPPPPPPFFSLVLDSFVPPPLPPPSFPQVIFLFLVFSLFSLFFLIACLCSLIFVYCLFSSFWGIFYFLAFISLHNFPSPVLPFLCFSVSFHSPSYSYFLTLPFPFFLSFLLSLFLSSFYYTTVS